MMFIKSLIVAFKWVAPGRIQCIAVAVETKIVPGMQSARIDEDVDGSKNIEREMEKTSD